MEYAHATYAYAYTSYTYATVIPAQIRLVQKRQTVTNTLAYWTIRNKMHQLTAQYTIKFPAQSYLEGISVTKTSLEEKVS
jgi:hypothetical protein